MAWQGIPFILNHETIEDTVRVVLNSIPKIVIESPTNYTNAWITAGVSVFAGLIPASIAIWTFKRNAENMRAEREHQQNFLREDRLKQQEFLEADRSRQQESFEQDRQTQIVIAKNNFDMQVLSGNRQAWINTLRDIVAEYTVEAPGLMHATYDYRLKANYLEYFHNAFERNDPIIFTQDFKDKNKQAIEELELVQLRMNVRADKVTMLSSKILMMLNPEESEYEKVASIFMKIRVLSSDLSRKNEDGELFKKNIGETVKSMNELVSLMQKLLKNEWIRVKAGI